MLKYSNGANAVLKGRIQYDARLYQKGANGTLRAQKVPNGSKQYPNGANSIQRAQTASKGHKQLKGANCTKRAQIVLKRRKSYSKGANSSLMISISFF